MKIIVCIKQIRHTYARTGRSPDSHYINPEDSIYRVDPHDEAALELALRLKSAHSDTTVLLLTLGPMIAAGEAQRCMAAGADDLYQILWEENPSSNDHEPLDQPDAWKKSELLARAVRELEGDLILCGKASLDRNSGQVGALVAHRLDLPFVSAITDLDLRDGDGGVLRVQRSAGRGVREIIECTAPALFSVDPGPELRPATLTARQWAEAYEPRKLNYTFDGDNPRIVCRRRFQPRPRPKLVPAPDSRLHAYERVMQLLTGSKIEKKGELLTGNPASQVEGIFEFLKANGILETDISDR